MAHRGLKREPLGGFAGLGRPQRSNSTSRLLSSSRSGTAAKQCLRVGPGACWREDSRPRALTNLRAGFIYYLKDAYVVEMGPARGYAGPERTTSQDRGHTERPEDGGHKVAAHLMGVAKLCSHRIGQPALRQQLQRHGVAGAVRILENQGLGLGAGQGAFLPQSMRYLGYRSAVPVYYQLVHTLRVNLLTGHEQRTS